MTATRSTPRVHTSATSLAVAFAALLALGWSAATPRGDDSKLYDLMEGIKGNLKTIVSSVKDPKLDAKTQEALAEMEASLLAAKGEMPTNLSDHRGDARAAHIAAYRADMARTLIKVLEVEIAMLEGRRDEAFAIAVKDLHGMRKAGHGKYQGD